MAGKPATLSLGPIDDSDETWINGIKVGATKNEYAKPRQYVVPPNVLKTGKNLIAIRMEDTGNRGGVYGRSEDMFIATGNRKISIDGEWKYEVEKQYNADQTPIFKTASIGELFVNNYLDKATATLPAEQDATTPNKDVQVIQIKVLENEMKYDLKTFTVEAGKTVEIVFINPDFMQHNLVIAKPGTLETVGKAADKLATDPKGAAMHYVPDMPEVLFSTQLINPQESVKLQFTAPLQAGDYPYVCTFPGHWSIMNGVMKVVQKKTAL
jgi:azurin